MSLGSFFVSVLIHVLCLQYLIALSHSYGIASQRLLTWQQSQASEFIRHDFLGQLWGQFVPALDYGAGTRAKDSLSLCLLKDLPLEEEIPLRCRH